MCLGHGFFPDAGLSYFLSRLDDGLGMYLALTGEELTGADLVHAGIATHFHTNQDLHFFVQTLQETSGFHETVHEKVESFDEEWEEVPFSLEPHLDAIFRCFGKANKDGTVKDIVAALDKEGTEWAAATKATLLEKSPLALEVTFKALALARDMSLEEALLMEFKAARRVKQEHDYKEGVTATMVHPPRAPVWSHKSLNDIKKSDISKFFPKDNETADLLSLPFLDMKDPYALDYKNRPPEGLSKIQQKA
jgi:3-hydroxyisobutyryl-CoA hydrolase